MAYPISSAATRRTVLAAALGSAAVLAGASRASAYDPKHPTKATMIHAPGQAPTVTSADIRFTPRTTLRAGRAEQVGLDADTLARLSTDVTRFLDKTPETPAHPEYAGATVIAVKDGVVVHHEAVGKAVRYGLDAAGTTVVELPEDEQVDATLDTIWDLASMSKLFTATAVMQLIEKGLVGLEEPVVTYLPDFAAQGKSDILVRHLLTHTSGLIPDPVPSLWEGYTTIAERRAAILATTPSAAPGTTYVYSDLNFLTLGLIVEKISGKTLDVYVHDHITKPLGLEDTGYNPPATKLERIAATEYEPWADRGMVRGQVHDENAWALGGVAGHAGVFSTAYDIAVFAQMYLNGGVYRGTRILQEETVRLMLHDYNGAQFPTDTHGLAWELGQVWYHGSIWSPVSFGHTGFTGTTIVVNPIEHQTIILLCNRVHPDRNWGSNNPSRRAVADDLGLATPVKPRHGASVWFSNRTDKKSATLDVPLAATSGATLTFDYWYDTEPLYDFGYLQTSTDGTTFTQLPFHLEGGGWSWDTDGSVGGYGGRTWLRGSVALPDGTTTLRWVYKTDSSSEGRGIRVGDVTVSSGDRTVYSSLRPTDAAKAVLNGWTVV